MNLIEKIRNVPDFPKAGIQFKDITTLLAEGDAFLHTIDLLAKRYESAGLTKVVGIESRGFIFGAALACKLGIGFVPVRKEGKLPSETIRRAYELEYGEAVVEIHSDALTSSDKVVIIDDLIATGGTLEAACELVDELGADIHEVWCLLELTFLNGRDKLKRWNVRAEIAVDSE